MIRKTYKSDALELSELAHSLSPFYIPQNHNNLPMWLMSSLSISSFIHRIESHEFYNLVYEKDDKIIGFISIQNFRHVFHIFVDKAHHRQGIATKLWEYADKELQSNQYTTRSSVQAVATFQSFGFKPNGEVFIKDGVKFVTMVRQKKDL